MLLTTFLTLLVAHIAQSQTTAPFVSGPVSCTAVAVQFAVNPNNPSFQKLFNFTALGLVGVFADHAAAKCSDYPITVLNDFGTPTLDVSIGFAYCNITIDALYGAQQQLLEYSATIYARMTPVDLSPDGSNITMNANYPNLTFPITCNWLTGAQVSNNASITNNDPQPPPPVGNTTSPVDQLNMTLTDADGNILNQVEAGTKVRVVLALNGDSFYNSELPEYCSVSNAANPTTGTFIAVIANYCPYKDTIDNSPFHFRAYQQDNHTYFFDFDAFVYNNQPTTLYISCYIQVCLNVTDCTRDCWPLGNAKESFSAATSNRQYRRALIQFNGDMPPVANTSRSGSFQVVPKSDATGTTNVPATSSGGLPDWALILIIFFTGFLLFSLLLCFFCCVCCGVGLGLWSRRHGKHRDHRRTEYIYPQSATVPPTFTTDSSSIYHMEIPKVNLSSSSSGRSITSDKSYKY